eukprot:TRINITY_DN9775_c0_g1_i2.p1 TRINITY_DN9775_c0_g1~~TRINITY_DN9775_c0_g1_i2.p1  ORF type:complete len:450 (-),score=95.08 TRINITY_DN9775_c0_g1_i2:67-1416(-)
MQQDFYRSSSNSDTRRFECYRCIVTVFAELIANEEPPFLANNPKFWREQQRPVFVSNEAKDRMLNHCSQLAFASTDAMFHEYLYNWFLQCDLGRALLKRAIDADSPFIEPFLQQRQELEYSNSSNSNVDTVVQAAGGVGGIGGGDDDDDEDLLTKYYKSKHEYKKAAERMAEIAEKKDGISLSTRIKFLSRGVLYAKSAIGAGELHRDLHERMIVARTQQQVLSELKEKYAGQAEHEHVRSANQQLCSGLLSISELYNKFATPFKLYKACLNILHASGYQVELATVQKYWTQIIQEELMLLEGISATGSSQGFVDRVVAFAKPLYPSEFVLPIAWLTLQLERVSEANGWAVDTVVTLMLRIGVSHSSLFKIYSASADVVSVPKLVVLVRNWLSQVQQRRLPLDEMRRMNSHVINALEGIDTSISPLAQQIADLKNDWERLVGQADYYSF